MWRAILEQAVIYTSSDLGDSRMCMRLRKHGLVVQL